MNIKRLKVKSTTADKHLLERKLHAQVIELIAQGKTRRYISQRLRISGQKVQNIYWNAIRTLDADIQTNINLIRTRQLNDIYAMVDELQADSTVGTVDRIETKLRLLDREAKLLSLYPTEQPTAQTLIVIGFPTPNAQPRLDSQTVEGAAILISPSMNAHAYRVDEDTREDESTNQDASASGMDKR